MPSSSAGPLEQPRGVLGGDALVDRLADHRRHHRLASHPDDAERHPAQQGAATGPSPSTTGTARRPVVGGAGVVEGERAHPPTVGIGAGAQPPSFGGLRWSARAPARRPWSARWGCRCRSGSATRSSADVEVERGDQHRAHDERVEQDAERDREADLGEGRPAAASPSTANVAGQHQAGRGDHAAGGGQRDQRRPAGCRALASPRAPGSSGRCCSRCPARPGTRTRTAGSDASAPAKPKHVLEEQRADARARRRRTAPRWRSGAAARRSARSSSIRISNTTSSTTGMITRLSRRGRLLDVEVDRRCRRRPARRRRGTACTAVADVVDRVERGLRRSASAVERAPR